MSNCEIQQIKSCSATDLTADVNQGCKRFFHLYTKLYHYDIPILCLKKSGQICTNQIKVTYSLP